MNDEVEYPVIKLEDVPEEVWQELEDKWKRMEAHAKACANNGEPLVALEHIIEDWGDMTNEVGTPINDYYKVGDAVFVHYKVDGKVLTTIGFLVHLANREDTILARTVSPLSDFITIPDDKFICLGHIKHLEGAN